MMSNKGFVLIFGLLFTAAAGAVPQLRSLSDDESPAGIGALFSGQDPIRLESRYAEILRLYQAGKVNDAKGKLAALLQQDQRDVVALDIAGSIYLWERRLKEAQVSFEAALFRQKKDPAIMAKLGVVRLMQGDTDKGLRILRLANQLDADNVLALKFLAGYEDNVGNYDLAINLTRRLHRLEGESSVYLPALAELQSKARRYADQVALLGETPIDVRGGEPRDVRLALYLAEAYLGLGQPDKAEPLVRGAQARDLPELSFEGQRLGVVLAGLQRGSAAAEQAAQRMTNLDQQQRRYLDYTLAETFSRSGDVARAKDKLLGLAEGFAAEGNVHLLGNTLNDLAGLLLRQDLKREALQTVEKYRQRFPDAPRLGYLLAEVQYLAGRRKAARQTLTELIASDERFVPALMLDGRLARERREYPLAGQRFDEVVRIAPGHVDAWVQSAGLRADQGDHKSAAAVLGEALKHNPRNLKLMYELANMYEVAGEAAAALSQYELIVRAHPEFLPALDNLVGRYLETQDNLPRALALAERAVALAPDDPFVLSNHGYALFLSGDQPNGLAKLRAAAKAAKDAGLPHYQLGLALWQTEDRGAARAELKTALSLGLSAERQAQARSLLEQ